MKAFIVLAGLFLVAQSAAAQVVPPPFRICTAVAGVLYHPVTGEAVGFSDGCEQADLLAQGYLTLPPQGEDDVRMCLQVLIPMWNPETGETTIASDSCEANDLAAQGWLRS